MVNIPILPTKQEIQIMAVTIEKNIPYEEKNSVYPWKDMEVGDSFFLEFPTNCRRLTFQNRIHSAARSASFRHKKRFKASTSECKEGVRVWRLEDKP